MAAPRTNYVKHVPGGWGALTRLLLHDLFIDSKVATIGVKLQLNVETVVRVDFGALLGDEEALSTIWGGKGASGLVPCLKCSCTNDSLNWFRHSQVLHGLREWEDEFPEDTKGYVHGVATCTLTWRGQQVPLQ